MPVTDNTVFKHCAICDSSWETREDFLADPELQLIGYQPHFKALTTGFLFFNHSCKATLAIEVMLLRDLYDGPVFEERLTGTKNCPGYCLNRAQFDPCPNECEWHYPGKKRLGVEKTGKTGLHG